MQNDLHQTLSNNYW